jgi:hypothetical protein
MKTHYVLLVRLFYRALIPHPALCDVLCTIDTAIAFLAEAGEGPSSWAMTARDGAVGVSRIPSLPIVTLRS